MPIDQDLQQISQNLYSFLDLTLHQVHYAFSEISVQAHSLGVKVIVSGSLNVFMGIINVFLFDENLEDFEKGVAAIKLVQFWVDLLSVAETQVLEG